MNGPGRADLAEAVAGHRNNRRWSGKSMAMRAGFSAGTVKNIEGKRGDLLPTTLVGIDKAFDWEPGTAEAILVNRANAPAFPSRQPVAAGALPRMLQAEMYGQEMYGMRTVQLSGHAKLVIAITGDDDVDIAAIHDALGQVDDLFRKFRGDE